MTDSSNTILNINSDIKRACEVLRNGGIILYPTDTVWGIGCDATNADAVAKIGSERILFGTDFPGYNIQPFIDAVLNSGLSDNNIDDIMYNNAVNLLKVK